MKWKVGQASLRRDSQGPFQVEVWAFSRNGSKSPTLVCYKYNDRWISPFEQHVRSWEEIPLTFFFRIYYDRPGAIRIKDLLYVENPFLKLIPKDTPGGFFPVPLVYK